jgi:hypothetical protein
MEKLFTSSKSPNADFVRKFIADLKRCPKTRQEQELLDLF